MAIQISFTQISQFLICPRRIAFLQAGTKTPLTQAMALGKLMHWGIKESYLRETPAARILEIGLEQLMAGQELNGSPFGRESLWDGQIEGRESLAEWLPWLSIAVEEIRRQLGDPLALELPLERQDGGIVFQGVLDAIARDGRIIDFKLSSPKAAPSKLQALSYAYLAGGPSRFQFWLIRKESAPRLEIQDVPEAGEEAHLCFFREQIIAPIARALEAGIFPANWGGFLCSPGSCLYWELCVGSLKGGKDGR